MTTEEEENRLLHRVMAAIEKSGEQSPLSDNEIKLLRRVTQLMAGAATLGTLWSIGVRLIQVIGVISLIIMVAKTWSLADLSKFVGVK